MPVPLSQLGVLEDCIHIVRGEDGKQYIVLTTCSSIKYSEGKTLQTLLGEILQRLDNLENGSLTWNGIPQE